MGDTSGLDTLNSTINTTHLENSNKLEDTTTIVGSDDSESDEDVQLKNNTNENLDTKNNHLDDPPDDEIDETKENLDNTQIISNTLEATDTVESEMETIQIDTSDDDDEIKHLQKDADREQMIKVYFLFIIEIFKVAMASFLALSVVQNCEGSVCSYDQNIKRNSGYGKFVIAVNIINVLGFAILYFFEFNREMFLIEYLDIDKRKGDYHLPKVLDEYNNIKQRLKKYNKTYFICTKTILLLTSINWILSGILVIGSYYSFKTITSFATNILLVITKLSDSHSVSKESHRHNYGLSAYIKEYTSFNVIDKDHVKKT